VSAATEPAPAEEVFWVYAGTRTNHRTDREAFLAHMIATILHPAAHTEPTPPTQAAAAGIRVAMPAQTARDSSNGCLPIWDKPRNPATQPARDPCIGTTPTAPPPRHRSSSLVHPIGRRKARGTT
jgi:hypothetical protein